MKATSRTGYGSGWHKQAVRHSNARKTGRAGGTYVEFYVKRKGFFKPKIDLEVNDYLNKNNPKFQLDIENPILKKNLTKEQLEDVGYDGRHYVNLPANALLSKEQTKRYDSDVKKIEKSIKKEKSKSKNNEEVSEKKQESNSDNYLFGNQTVQTFALSRGLR